ncbi:MAG: GAF domain-containing sensor histidine kinase [Anaerolineales bacterium]
MSNTKEEKLEEQLHKYHQASFNLVRDLSLDTVLKRIVRLARDQAQAEYGALAIRDEKGEIIRFITIGMTEEEESRIPHLPEGKGLLGELQNKNQIIRISNIKDDPRRLGFPENHPPMDSMLGVPILSGERIIGQIYLTNKKDEPEFTGNDARLIKTLAGYAAVAITNAQLYNNIIERDQILNQQNEDLSLINDLAQTVASSLEIKEIMSQTLTRVLAYLDIETGEIFLRDKSSKDLRLSLLRGDGFEAFSVKNVFRVGEGLVGKVAGLNKPLVSYALDTDPRIIRSSISEAGFTCLAGIPLQAQRKVVGVMTLSSKKDHQYTTRELDLLTTIGTWAGTAIENARLQQQSKRVAILEERERIGMDLHDGIIQSLYSIGLTLDLVKQIFQENPSEACEKLNVTTDAINQAITDIRSYVSDLRPRQMKANRTFSQNIEQLIQEFKRNSNITMTLGDSSQEPLNLPYENAVALFHILQETLANTARHSDATKAKVELWENDGRVYVKVEDNGKGFNLDKTEISLGHGLSNMKRRTRKVGGEVEIESAPLQGTSVLAWVPKKGLR